MSSWWALMMQELLWSTKSPVLWKSNAAWLRLRAPWMRPPGSFAVLPSLLTPAAPFPGLSVTSCLMASLLLMTALPACFSNKELSICCSICNAIGRSEQFHASHNLHVASCLRSRGSKIAISSIVTQRASNPTVKFTARNLFVTSWIAPVSLPMQWSMCSS